MVRLYHIHRSVLPLTLTIRKDKSYAFERLRGDEKLLPPCEAVIYLRPGSVSARLNA
jgi:hypothetical protein